MSLSFKDRVVIVTGSGNGLGKAYALAFAKLGAKVVINDLGGSFKGEGSSQRTADLVVDEIKKMGGEAVANYDSVEFGDKIVKTAIDTWGRVDVVVNNAGILRDVSFAKMQDKDYELVHTVHMKGTYSVSHAAWPYMREQRYGRIVNVTSAAGLYGNFGQANYSSAKLGIVGLMNTLAKEGKGRNILVNTIAPLAGSRMTETVMPPDLVAALHPDYVAPLVMILSSEGLKDTGGIFEVAPGWVAKVRFARNKGMFIPLSLAKNPDTILKNWGKLNDWSNISYPQTINEGLSEVVQHINKKELPRSDKVDPNITLGAVLPSSSRTLTSKDLINYALAVGCGANDATSDSTLRFTYENHPKFSMLPTMGVTMTDLMNILGKGLPGLNFNPMMLLHGEQHLEILNTPPVSGTVTTNAKITELWDKGKGALVSLETTTVDENDTPIFKNKYSLFIRGIGGWGGERGPKGVSYKPPNRDADCVVVEKTKINQALEYRLPSGDANPLHIDPNLAAMGGFDKPILHGLCTFGFAGRAVLEKFCDNDPSKFKGMSVRFAGHVFPGETLETSMWKENDKVILVTKVQERGTTVLSNAVVFLAPSPKLLT